MPQTWHDFARANASLVQSQRIHSKVFLRSESLDAKPLVHNTKHHSSAPENLEEWSFLDQLPDVGYAALLVRGKTFTHVDIDFDAKPLAGEDAWTKELIAESFRAAERFTRGLMAMGLDCRHSFGRTSQGGWGHVYLSVAAASKDEYRTLASLGMRKPIKVGGLRIKVEVRVARDPKVATTPLRMTLPGSTYPDRWDPDEFDLIRWRLALKITEATTLPTLEPEPIPKLVKGLFTGLMAVVMEPHWVSGSRHEKALEVAGVLAREVNDIDAILDDADAGVLLEYLCDSFRDDEKADRLKALEQTLSSVSRDIPVTGWPRLTETIGEDARNALLRIRGGADPDRLAELLENFAYVHNAPGGIRNAYLDLSNPFGTVICRDTRELVNHFDLPQRYPPRRQPNGKEIKLINVALESRQRQNYMSAVDLPGTAFKAMMVRSDRGFRPAREDELHDTVANSVQINIGTGYAIDCPEIPDRAAMQAWRMRWSRHLWHVCGGDRDAILKLEKAIAWSVQHPLEKIPLGLVLTGGGGIGKSFIFEHILPAVLGHRLFATNTIMSLSTDFRLSDIEGKKFYVFEESNFTTIDNQVRELLKDLMKSSKLTINRKYGAKGEVDNFALPVFLTNEPNPTLHVQGQIERSLYVIEGDTREKLGMDLERWNIHVERIAANCKDMVVALQISDLREAAMYYFARHIKVDRSEFDNNQATRKAITRDMRASLANAIFTVIERGYLHPNIREMGVACVVSRETFAHALLDIMRGLNASRNDMATCTPDNVVSHINKILGPETMVAHQFRAPDGKRYRIYYIKPRLGDLISRAKQYSNVELEAPYELTPEDYGDNPPPKANIAQTAYKYDLERPSAGNVGY